MLHLPLVFPAFLSGILTMQLRSTKSYTLLSKLPCFVFVALLFIFSANVHVSMADEEPLTSTHVQTPRAAGAQVHSSTNSPATPNVYGGTEAEPGEYPWMVALAHADIANPFYGQFCGGSLIAPQWVLTAAHCTFRAGIPRMAADIHVIADTTFLSNPDAQRLNVTQIIRHPAYEYATADADIALLRLATPLELPTLQLADATTGQIERPGTLATILGWGATQIKLRTNTLLYAQVPVVAQEECRQAYSNYGYELTDNMICAGFDSGGIDACQGDSGGPLVVWDDPDARWVEIGIVSWGKGCALPNMYGVYTRTSNFRTWIDVQIIIHRDEYTGTTTLPIGVSLSPRVYLPLVSR